MSNEKISNYLKDFKDYLPLILVVFYCLGYSKMIGYYSVFDIDIEYYLSLNDFIFVAIKDLINILTILFFIDIISIIVFIFFLIIYHRFIKKEPWKKAVREGKKQEFEENLGVRAFQLSFVVTSITLMIWIAFFSWYKVGFVYLIMTALLQMSRSAIFDSKSTKTRKQVYSFVLIFTLIGGFYLWGQVEGRDASEKLRVWDREVIFTLEGEKFSSLAENQIFLGETTGYIFIYDPEKKSTRVISKENIQGFTVIQKFNDWINKSFFW